jgi:hypothetical protein
MGLLDHVRENFFLFGLGCLVWYALRTGSKPSRAVYPCQRVAAANANLWIATYLTPFFAMVEVDRFKMHWKTIVVVLLIGVGAYGYMSLNNNDNDELTPVKLKIEPMSASEPDPSIIYTVTGTNVNDDGVKRLIDLMSDKNQPFYKSAKDEGSQGPDGFIANTDVVLIKVNSQWDERGGTNTDLVKSLIAAIINHPDGWKGEIVVADNGQAQYGGIGKGGSLDWGKSNAQDPDQSIQDVVDMYAKYRVSTYLWDTITINPVQEFAEGDNEDGYVVQTSIIASTGTVVSYPKFTTPFGTQISFKYGVYKPEIEDYDVDRLKVISVPVLKTHMIYGVTGAVKHYMGVPSDKLSAGLGYRIHSAVGKGAMGTLMAQTRVPTLNIIDAIYVNAIPKDGPKTPYSHATETNIIAASTDPVAIDYWASKNILCRIASENGDNISTMDPDNTNAWAFGNWLRLSLAELNAAGYPFTVDPEKMTVYVDLTN